MLAQSQVMFGVGLSVELLILESERLPRYEIKYFINPLHVDTFAMEVYAGKPL